MREPGTELDAIVLAAGASTRMGRPKALLPVDGETFLARALRVLRDGGCRHIVVVVAGYDADLTAVAAEFDAHVVVNDDPTSEQYDSLCTGVRALPDESAGVAILPVDCPLIMVSTVEQLTERLATTSRPILLPMHNGVGGHPVVLQRAFYDEVLRATPPEGLRALIVEHGTNVEIVRVNDPGVLVDIDTPQDYTRFVERE